MSVYAELEPWIRESFEYEPEISEIWTRIASIAKAVKDQGKQPGDVLRKKPQCQSTSDNVRHTSVRRQGENDE